MGSAGGEKSEYEEVHDLIFRYFSATVDRDNSEKENSVKLHEGIAFVSLKRFDFERSLSSYLLFKSSLTWYIIHDFYFERKYKKFQET